MNEPVGNRIVQKLRLEAWILGNASIYVFIGAILRAAYICTLESELSNNVTEYWAYGLTALITLVASGIALAGVFFDIANSNINEEKRRRASMRAAKSTLPLALTELSRVCSAGLKYAEKDGTFFTSLANQVEYEKDTAVSDETLATMRSCIEYSDMENDGAADWLALIVQHYQVANARFIGNFQNLPSGYGDENGADHIKDWIVLKALVEHLFDFSRGAETVPAALDPSFLKVPILAPWRHKPLEAVVIARIVSAKQYYAPFTSENFQLS